MHRRQFLASSFLGAPAFLYGQPTRKFNIALVGTGSWGMNILTAAMRSGECNVVGMCDVDPNQLQPAADRVIQASGDNPRKYRDYRELLAKERPEITIVATPDHWHPLVAIDAMKSGSHVYVEKPVSHTVLEGKAMVDAARQSDRVVQVGLHRRVSPHNVSGRDFLRSGKAGKIGIVRAFVHSPGNPGQRTPDSEPPLGMDWDMWCGPAPLRQFNRTLHPKGFRQYLDYANGTLGDWGVHWMDQVLGWSEEKYPRRIYSTGGRHIKQDNTDAPDTQVASYEFESFTVEWEHRTYAANRAEKANLGAYFYGTAGTFHMGWPDGWTFYPASKNQDVIHQAPQLLQPDDRNVAELFSDFLSNIKARKRPMSDIEIGHRSTSMGLLGMLSMKVGRSVQWDGEKEQIVGDTEANQLLQRTYREPWKYPNS